MPELPDIGNGNMPAEHVEHHPLQPFLPENARLLMLGSFPPPKERWCMDFFYPNPQNDMWRIMGLVFFGDKMHFVEQGVKTRFRYAEIVSFCREKGIAIFDTAQAVRRLQHNASDEHLEIVEKTDIAALLEQLPHCHDICCTGGKAAETLAETIAEWQKTHSNSVKPVTLPQTGGYTETTFAGRAIRFWRMPSSSRAYPLPIDKKADTYRRMLDAVVNRKTIEVVAAIISDGQGRIFATQRGYGEWKDWWEFPGGKTEPQESPQEALKREIREELDAEIEVGGLFQTIDYDYPQFHLTMHCFSCTLVNDHMTLLEHEAAKWLEPAKLHTVKWLPADMEIINALAQSNKSGIGVSLKQTLPK